MYFQRLGLAILFIFLTKPSSAETLQCKGIFTLDYQRVLYISPGEIQKELKEDVIAAGYERVASVEFLGSGAEGFVVRINFEFTSGKEPILLKKFVTQQSAESPHLRQQLFLNKLLKISREKEDMLFSVIEPIGLGVFESSLLFKNVEGRDLNRILADRRIEASLRLRLLEKYNTAVRELLEEFLRRDPRSRFRDLDWNPNDFTDLNYTYLDLPHRPQALAKRIEFENSVMILKPDNVVVTKDLELYIIDMQ